MRDREAVVVVVEAHVLLRACGFAYDRDKNATRNLQAFTPEAKSAFDDTETCKVGRRTGLQIQRSVKPDRQSASDLRRKLRFPWVLETGTNRMRHAQISVVLGHLDCTDYAVQAAISGDRSSLQLVGSFALRRLWYTAPRGSGPRQRERGTHGRKSNNGSSPNTWFTRSKSCS